MADKLRMDYINSLAQPFLAHLFGDGYKYPWPIVDIDVQTGLIRIDVCGKLQVIYFADISKIIDCDGNDHNPDTFYSDYVE
jgi:hypothetical protein